MNWGQIVLFILTNWDKVVKPILALLHLPTNFNDFMDLLLKGDTKMNNNLFYEVKVVRSSEIKETYEQAVKDNTKYYLCMAPNGQLLGWNNNTYITVENAKKQYPDIVEEIDGKTWFINPLYKEEQPIEETVIEEPIGLATVVEPVIEPKPAEVAEPLNKPSEEIKAGNDEIDRFKENFTQATESFIELQKKYEVICKELDEANAQIEAQNKQLAEAKAEYNALKEKYDAAINDDYNATEQLTELREAANTFLQFIKGAKNA